MKKKFTRTREVSVLLSPVELAKLMLADEFDPNAQAEFHITALNGQQHKIGFNEIAIVQFVREEVDGDTTPPPAVDPDA